jgi:hypothetical protein
MRPCAFTSADGKADDPHNGEDDRRDPQDMYGKSRTEEEKYEQQREQ